MKLKSSLRKASKLAILLVLPLALTALIGCSKVTLHPILKQDIVNMPKGTTYTSDRDGYFLSDLYVNEVMQAKVEKVKLK